MDITLILLSVGTIVCSLGFMGWLLELVGWEEKKMKLWEEGKSKKKSLLHRFGFWLFFPMAIFANETGDHAESLGLGWTLVFATIALVFLIPYMSVWLIGIWEKLRS